MKKMRTKKSLLILSLVLILIMSVFGACAQSAPEPEPAPAPVEEPAEEPAPPAVTGEILIAAAASLENTLTQELIPAFNAEFPEVNVTGSYDSSGKLQEQIEGGLDAAVFFSAATKQMTALVEGGFVDEANVVKLLENQVVLITSVNSDTKVTGFENITDAKDIAIGDPESVPAGEYAKEVLTSLGLWDQVEKGASLGTNVTEVLNWVAEGSAEVGIVYSTDAASLTDKVKVLAVAPADSLEKPIIYPAAVTNNVTDANKEAAEAFVTFLQSDAAKAIFEKYGFKPL